MRMPSFVDLFWAWGAFPGSVLHAAVENEPSSALAGRGIGLFLPWGEAGILPRVTPTRVR